MQELGGNYPNSELETKHPLIKMGNIDRGSIDTSKVEYVAEDQRIRSTALWRCII